jgi:hypothetical protein
MVSGGPSGPAQGQQQYTTPGTYTWVAPAGVTSICVVCVGGGAGNTSNFNAGGGGGGALAWDNNIAVTAGSSYTIVVGAGGVGSIDPEGNAGGNSSFSVGPVRANGGGSSGSAWAGGTTFGGDGGGNGGDGKISNLNGSGGGAGGYTGVGGKGATRFETPTAGAGGAGGGGWAGDITYNEDGSIYINYGGGGGGVGLLGQGSNGFAAGSLSGGAVVALAAAMLVLVEDLMAAGEGLVRAILTQKAMYTLHLVLTALAAQSALSGAQVAPFHQLTQGMYDVSYCTRKRSANRQSTGS